MSFAIEADSSLRSSGRRKLGDNENNKSSDQKIPLLTFYPFDIAIAGYMKIPHNTVLDGQNRRRDSIRIVLDYQENMDEMRPAEAPIPLSLQWLTQWLSPRVDGTNFYKILFVVRPFEY